LEWTSGQLGQLSYPAATVVMATLLDYAAATYGREYLPLLMANFGKYESWERLIPAVFGITAAQFEAGWQAYLATYYKGM
jgi:hypothetical protein